MIFVTGATGFVGGHLISALLRENFQVRCLSRSERSKKYLAAIGAEVVDGDVTRPESLAGCVNEGDIVVHLVGIIQESKGATFDSVHVGGTTNLVLEAKKRGVRHFVYQSALGADRNSWSAYLRTKAQAEEIVKSSQIPYTILRPSLIIGPWDGFTKKIVDILKISPFIPLPGGGKAKFQPIYIKDWTTCALRVIDSPEDFRGTFDIGGPEHLTYKELVTFIAGALKKHRPNVEIPLGLMKIAGAFFDKMPVKAPFTSEQIALLEMDNICSTSAVDDKFGFTPTTFTKALKEFI